MMSAEIDAFLSDIRRGRPVVFRETLALIEQHYDYHPTRFSNGLGVDLLVNEPGINEGSCKIFSFAARHGLAEPETLALFGEYYRDEVLPKPHGEGHKNIRNFMKFGWGGIDFEGDALSPRKQAEV